MGNDTEGEAELQGGEEEAAMRCSGKRGNSRDELLGSLPKFLLDKRRIQGYNIGGELTDGCSLAPNAPKGLPR